VRDTRFAHGEHNACEQGKEDQSGGGHSDFVAKQVFSAAISDGTLARQDRQVLQMSADIFRELLRRAVTFALFLANCLQDNVVEVARKAVMEFF
jgi:hypothetical protein